MPISLSSLPVELSEPIFGAKVLDEQRDSDKFHSGSAGGYYEVVPNEFCPRRSVLVSPVHRTETFFSQICTFFLNRDYYGLTRTDLRRQNSLGTSS